MDPETEQKVAEWQAAKDSKDYATADHLRDELRAAGIDPEPKRRGGRGGGGGSRESDVDRKLRLWNEAKANKDFATADSLRAELRNIGVEPDPKRGGGGAVAAMPFHPVQQQFVPMAVTSAIARPSRFGGAGGYDRALERELDNWTEARATRDFETADAIRQSLRARGISPKKQRPDAGTLDGEIAQWQSAREAKDFQRSDKLRQALRDKGVDPETGGERPVFGAIGAGPPVQQYQQYVPVAVQPQFVPVAIQASPRGQRFDRALENELAQWFAAKDRKDFATADSIRDGLRRRGISPAKCQRPAPVVGAVAGRGAGRTGEATDPNDIAKLRQWFEAKEVKDFATADQIRDDLRASGIEPDRAERPPSAADEDDIREWFEARDAKDFVKADAIRDALRSRGIEPSKHKRPLGVNPADFEAELLEWFEARDRKDYATADAIRDQLRGLGLDPQQCQRPGGGYGKAPSGGKGTPSGGKGRSSPYLNSAPDTQVMIEQWRELKAAKQFEQADAIRAELRAMGVEPEQRRR